MTLDPRFVAAMVTAAGRGLTRLLEPSDGREGDEEASAVETIYPKLHEELSDNSVRVLLLLESGPSQPPALRRRLEELIERQKPRRQGKIESDLTYRLKYLCLLGLLTPVAGAMLSVTRLGRAYLEKARLEGHHPMVLAT